VLALTVYLFLGVALGIVWFLLLVLAAAGIVRLLDRFL
jgi:hypothetical protein